MIKFKNILALGLSLLLTTQSFAQITAVQEQSTDKNYIVNGGFESAKAGWVTYKNTAQALPITGTGGTPAVTLAASTSSPIAGKSSGVITKGASNLQGEGISYAFSVDSAAKGRVLTISGLYQIVSGTYSGGTSTTDSDVELYIYDVDAAQIIQPAGYKLDGGVSGINYNIAATFQANLTSTNYRLIVHVATVSSSAYSLKLDSIKIGIPNKSQGPPVTDKKLFSMVIGAATTAPTKGTVANEIATWRRVGDSMEIEYELYTSSAGSAGSGTYLFPIPSGYSIDSSKVAVNFDQNIASNLGVASAYSPSFAGLATGYSYAFNNTNIALVIGNNSNNLNIVSSTYFNLNASAVTYKFRALVPIQGWGSTVTMSDSADTRVVAASGKFGALSITTTLQTLPLTTVSKDTHGAVSGNTVVIKVPGIYRIAARASISSSTNDLYLQSFINSVVYGNSYSSGTNSRDIVLDDTAELKAGDIINFSIQAGSGTGVMTGAGYTSWSVTKMSGPSQIAASETVAISYSSSAGGSIGTSDTVQSFATKIYDTHGAWSGSVFTAPIAGKYHVAATILTNAVTLGTTSPVILSVNKNGSSYRRFATTLGNGSNSSYGANGSTTIDLLAGETLSIGAASAVATSQFPASSFNYVTIERVGN